MISNIMASLGNFPHGLDLTSFVLVSCHDTSGLARDSLDTCHFAKVAKTMLLCHLNVLLTI